MGYIPGAPPATSKRARRGEEKPEVMRLDLRTALAIAGYAGIETRDRRGNVSGDVWVRHTDTRSLGQLIEAGDVKQLLMEQLRNQLSAQKDLLGEVEDGKVSIEWILEFAAKWEDHWRDQINKNFDISQKIESAMHDAVHLVWPLLEGTPLDCGELLERIRQVTKKGQQTGTLEGEQALVRFFFRNPYTRDVMRRFAGKHLQKKEVCNKAGMYSAKVQRNDITQERDAAFRDGALFVERREDELELAREIVDSHNLPYWIEDHRKAFAAGPFEPALTGASIGQ